MATTREPATPRKREVDYPTSDGRPLAETDRHRQVILDLITTFQERYADEPDVYVTGDLLLFYEEGDRHRHVAPDVFVVRGVPKLPMRDHYLLWKEGKSPDLVIEITSKTTRDEDQKTKFILYRDVIKIPEYFQFDPTEDYLRPSMQGHRLVDGVYVPIAAVDGRLPSAFLGLHLERDDYQLRLFDPATRRRILTNLEALQAERDASRADREALRIAQQQKNEAQKREAEAQQREAEAQQREAEAQRQADAVKAENERLLRELEALRRRSATPDA